MTGRKNSRLRKSRKSGKSEKKSWWEKNKKNNESMHGESRDGTPVCLNFFFSAFFSLPSSPGEFYHGDPGRKKN